MLGYKNDRSGAQRRPTWRDYQSHLKRPKKRFTARHLVLACLVVTGVFYALFASTAATRSEPAVAVASLPPPCATSVAEASMGSPLIGRNDVQLLLSQLTPNDLMSAQIALPFNNQQFKVKTSLDEDLQSLLVRAMDRRNSRFIGIVVIEADTGRVLSMAGFDKLDPEANPCLISTFPAASLFKIVTAAAAVEQYNYNSDTQLRFNGYKHTMYKNQLQETDNRYTHTISFADAFAESVNPVFGKLGKLQLGPSLLEQYAQGFGFNQTIDFELPVQPSHFNIKETPYHWAEIASGFNRETTISPVHAAMIISATLNQGRMVTPTLVESIEDHNGHLLYRSSASWSNQAMNPKASAVLKEIMEATVRSGTARSFFSGWQRDPVLSGLRIGGKTGSISTRSRDARIDWFAGFASKKDGSGQVVVAAVVAHEEFIGVRAGAYARMAMTHYFKNQLARQASPSKPAGS
jgi:penicillin-binding protein A